MADLVLEALRTESERLTKAMQRADGAALVAPTRCAPWTVAELLDHVSTGVGRLEGMLSDPEPDVAERDVAALLVEAAGYYRRDERFSPEVNAARIASAQADVAGASSPREVVARFERTWRRVVDLVAVQPGSRVVRTRHGDLMRLGEFLRTRVVELAVHGLDLADALGVQPWLSDEAAAVVGVLLVEGGDPGILMDLGWTRLDLINKATGRLPLIEWEKTLLDEAGVRLLSFG
jgi:uncharacterized protein (TIGR03083 family)